jgi:hypothetical protein
LTPFLAALYKKEKEKVNRPLISEYIMSNIPPTGQGFDGMFNINEPQIALPAGLLVH